MNHHRRGKQIDRHGAVAVMAAVFLVVVIAFMAFSVDFGYMVVSESELQNAADAGAMSGVVGLFKSSRSSSDDDDDYQSDRDPRKSAIESAKKWAAKNFAGGKSVVVKDEDVEIGVWDDQSASFTPIAPSSSQSPNAVRVTCHRTSARGNPIRLFIAPIFGTEQANLTVSATARIKTTHCGMIIGLNEVTMSGSSHIDSYRSEDGPYNASSVGSDGDVCSNGRIRMSGSTEILGDAHPGPGQRVISSSSKGVSGSTEPMNEPLSYPPTNPGDASTNNDNATIPLSDKGNQPLNGKGEFKLKGGDVVDLAPGTYYFSKMSLSGGSSIRVSGPTKIYVTGDCSLSGGSVVNKTFLPKNLQLFPMGARCVISGDAEFYGVVYAPTSKVERSGSSDYFGAIIANELVLSGSGGVHVDKSIDSDSLSGGKRRASLVQ